MNSAMRWSWVSRFMKRCLTRKAPARERISLISLPNWLAPGSVRGDAAPVNDTISRRLPHVITRADLVLALSSTYVEAMSVDEDEARDRLDRALQSPSLLQELHAALGAAVLAQKGPRTTEDALVDAFSKGVQARRSRVKPAPEDPAVSAVLVRINLEIGLAPETMRATLSGERGKAILDAGYRKLATHLVKSLMK
jgi:hypothetical protein